MAQSSVRFKMLSPESSRRLKVGTFLATWHHLLYMPYTYKPPTLCLPHPATLGQTATTRI